MRALEMAQQAMALATKCDNPSLIPQILVVRGKSRKLSSDCHMHTTARTWMWKSLTISKWTMDKCKIILKIIKI